ncbi:serine/threonine-protein phosphatase 7 long form-like protein [Senna tora]|uniref:Serine/threonine-protein phosphatase 7 long form-like protein n=1 Tax=Senna tora TaxID=362788 RepID=A0A834TSV6_9FABA|nr:serine/threonine-protein phosphatase 7 long form-like protein [Senna tora]
MPYSTPDVAKLIPYYCLNTPEIWRTSVPVICFYIVEWHHADRVLRQFGMTQPIPEPPKDLGDLHEVTLKGKTQVDWYQRHHPWIAQWQAWATTVIESPPATTALTRRSEYMEWYRRHTRRWIGPDSAAIGFVVDTADRLITQIYQDGSSFQPFAQEVGMGCKTILQTVGGQLPPFAQMSFQPSHVDHQVNDDRF